MSSGKSFYYSYRVLKRMRIFKKKIPGAMFLIMEGIVYTMILNLYNPFIQMFGKRMGAENIHIALLNAAPPLVAIFVLIPFGMLIERINRKKQTVLILLFISSLFYAAIAFVPAIPHQAKVMLYVILIGLLNCPGALYLTTWQSFFADNFKGSHANRVYSVRSKFGTFFGLLTVLLTGLLLTTVPKSDEDRLFLYQIFYGACFALTLVQLLLFSRVGERNEHQTGHTAGTDAESKSSHAFGKADFAGILSNKPFLIFCLCSFAFHFFWQMGWPLYFIYNANYANLNELQLSLVSVASGLAQFLSYSFWNKQSEMRGSSLIIVIGAVGIAVNPLFFTVLHSFPMILLINVFVGFFIAGFNLTLFFSLLQTLPEKSNTVYISVFNTLINISGFIAPLIGVWIYNKTNIYMSLGIIGLLRIIASMLYLIRWRKMRNTPAAET